MKNVIAFACIDKVAKSVSMIPWKLHKLDGSNDTLEAHPFSPLLRRANTEEDWMSFMYSLTSYLCIAGNGYVNAVRPSIVRPDAEAKEVWAMRPDRITIDVDKRTGFKLGYIYNYGTEGERYYDIDPITGKSDILHVKLFHPMNDFYGMSPIEPSARKIDTANSMDEWNKHLLDNMGKPGMLFFFKEALGEEQYERLKKDIRENVEGAKNSGKSLILEGATDAKPYGFTPSEMDWINSNMEMSRSTCVGFGVPPQLIGIPDTSTYSNYQEARAAFYEDTVWFYMTKLKASFNFGLLSDPMAELQFHIDDVPAMQGKRDKLWERANSSTFLKENEKRTMVGYDEVDGGDVILKPANLIPLGEDFGLNGNNATSEDTAKSYLQSMGYSDEYINRFLEASW